MLRLKKANDDAARLKRDEELALRLKGVTTWHERAETNPGANAKAETAALVLGALVADRIVNF
jgi:hypothetical protein